MDMHACLAPISASAPAGDDLSWSPFFDQIAHMRQSDDASLDLGEWVTPLKQADWAGVIALCERLLCTHSKDLRLAMWLTEALAMVHGPQGLAHGLSLCAALCQRHWPQLHPLPDGQDHSERSGQLGWLIHRVVALAAPHGPLTDTDDTAWSACLSALQDLQAEMAQRLGEEAPHCGEALQALSRRLPVPARAQGTSPAALPHHPTPTPAAHDTEVVGDACRSRANALQCLRDVAAYFRQHEPHSPVSYLATQAAAWGEMPLHTWLAEVVSDAPTLSRLNTLLGHPPSP